MYKLSKVAPRHQFVLRIVSARLDQSPGPVGTKVLAGNLDVGITPPRHILQQGRRALDILPCDGMATGLQDHVECSTRRWEGPRQPLLYPGQMGK